MQAMLAKEEMEEMQEIQQLQPSLSYVFCVSCASSPFCVSCPFSFFSFYLHHHLDQRSTKTNRILKMLVLGQGSVIFIFFNPTNFYWKIKKACTEVRDNINSIDMKLHSTLRKDTSYRASQNSDSESNKQSALSIMQLICLLPLLLLYK